MKKIVSILFYPLFLALAACGPIWDDLSDCPPSANTLLTFSYTGDTNDPEMFARMVDHVTLMVYGEDGNKVVERTIDKNELNKTQGTSLKLEPGNYRAICWGNANEHTQITGSETLTTGRLHNPAFTLGSEITTNSHLYYGVYEFTVPADGTVQGDVPFRGAHINIEVYIRSGEAAGSGFTVTAHNLMPQYNLGMGATRPFTTSYYPQMGYNAEKKLDACLFQTLRFDDNNPVVIEVREPSGALIRIDLRQYMADNDITVDGKNEATVPILLEYTDLGVTIKIPEWLSHNVTPGQ
ncbi:FimB/Mfa2 family fimbrial subunit [Alistipes sp. OttesenSCG-928-B03]|nr:FimB/Mfa2 family fimbrial subunit [Alistipes sp. OttesenSCG-928-B03]